MTAGLACEPNAAPIFVIVYVFMHVRMDIIRAFLLDVIFRSAIWKMDCHVN